MSKYIESYTSCDLSIHFLNDRNIVHELTSEAPYGKNPVPSLSLLNKINTDIHNDISSAISTLDYNDSKVEHEFVTQVSENDGIISVLRSKLISSDIDLLPEYVTNQIKLSIDNIDYTIFEENKLPLCIEIENGTLKSKTYTKIDDNFINVSSISEDKIINLTSDLNNLSNNYVKRSGDNMTGSLNINGKISSNSLYVYQEIGSEPEEKFYTNLSVDRYGMNVFIHGDTYSGESTRGIKISTDNALCTIFVNNKSISSYLYDVYINSTISADNKVKSSIESLDNTLRDEIETGKLISKITEDDGIITYETRYILSSDISNLNGFVNDVSNKKVYDLSVEIKGDIFGDETKTGLKSDLCSYINLKTSTVYKVKGSVKTYEELGTAVSSTWGIINPYDLTSHSILSSHIGEVWNVEGSSRDDPNISGQNYVWIFENKTPVIFGWDSIGGFADFSKYYTKTDVEGRLTTISNDTLSEANENINISCQYILTSVIPSKYNELSGIDFNISSNLTSLEVKYNSTSSQVDSILTYCNELSGTTEPGIITILSNDISSLYYNNIHTLKFIKHINSSDLISRCSLTELLHTLTESGNFENGTFFDVTLSSDADISTTDGVKLGHGDILILHEHSTRSQIPYNEITIHDRNSLTGNLYLFKSGISRYEFLKLSNDFNTFKSNVKTNIISCYTTISSVTNESDYATCVSCVVEIKNLLSNLIEIL